MKLTRVLTGDDGRTRFDEIDVPLADAGAIGRLSADVAAEAVVFRENDAGYDYDWHAAPRRQIVVMLDGAIEVEVGTGERRTFRGGDLILLEDTTGRGHRTRSIDGRARRSLFIVLGDAALPGMDQGRAATGRAGEAETKS